MPRVFWPSPQATFSATQAEINCRTFPAPGAISTIQLINKRLCSETELRYALARYGLRITEALLTKQFWIKREKRPGYVTLRSEHLG